MTSPEINAVEFKELTGSSNTANGSHGLFKFTTEQGEFTIALPNGQLPKLMASLSDISSKNARVQSGNQRQVMAFTCNVWDIAPGDNDTVNMTFRMPGGMEMTFQLSKKQIPLMKDALTSVETGQPIVPLAGMIG